MIITTQSPRHAFELRQALRALGHVPRSTNGAEVQIPTLADGLSMAALLSTLNRGGLTLEWSDDPDRAELVKMADRRREVA